MARRRRRFNPAFKSRVALEALKEQRTISELAQKYSLHPTQINLRKKQLQDGAEGVFEDGRSPVESDDGQPKAVELYERIGRLQIQLEWLKKKVAENCE
jgi:transposase